MLEVSGEKQKVVVSVRGGVAEVVRCPTGVQIQIIDHDNLAAERGGEAVPGGVRWRARG